MKTYLSNLRSRIRFLAATLLAGLLIGCVIEGNAQPATTLKDAYKAHFHIGVAVNRTVVTGTAVRADNVNRTLDEVKKDTAVVVEQFNQIVPENDLKWALVHPEPGPDGYNFAPADAFVNFGLSNNMYLVGHTLVWHGQTPGWVFQGTNLPPGITNASPTAPAVATNEAGTNAPGGRRIGRGGGRGRGGLTGPRASHEELLQRMRDHIHTVVGRYKGKIKAWDVVNEALSDGGTNVLRENSPWYQIIGSDFIAKAFEYAHEADPDAILRYNDYGLENPAKRRKLITLIKSLQEQNVPIHAIGSQAHVNVGTTFNTMDQALTEMKTLGLPIHITELDVNSAQGGQRSTSADISANASTTQGGLVSEADRRQAEAYADIFRAFLKHKDSMKVVTLWGINDAVSWRAQGRPLLFDGDDQPKPAFHAVIAEGRKTAETR